MKFIKLPDFQPFFTSAAKAKSIFDPIRKKSLVATPEELVRQVTVQYLIREKNFPRSLLGIEIALKVNRLLKRCDIVAYKGTQPVLLVECKAPSVKITQDVFDQIARYNLTLKVPYLLVTNGTSAMCCKIDLQKGSFEFLERIPEYSDL